MKRRIGDKLALLGIKKSPGFTLVESMVVLFIFAIVAMAFLETYAAGSRLIIESKNRLGATALANQKMEIIRSVEYDTIGTKRWNGSAWVYGIPPGEILEEEEVNVNTRLYHVHTFVQYVDHPFDGTAGGSPNDTIPTDMKRVRVTISWGERSPNQSVSLVSLVSPDGIETSSGGGVLSVNVLDAGGSGVSGATVRIVNTAAGIDVSAPTDATGNVTLPGAPAGSQNYQLTLSKAGYYGAVTYPPYPTTSYNPVDVHASVVANTLNQHTVVMDQEADIILNTVDPFGAAVANIAFTLSGGRVLGTDPATGLPVHAFSESGTTNSSGEASFLNESHGEYTLAISDSRYEFYKFAPEALVRNILDVLPGATEPVEAIVLDRELGSLKVVVRNGADETPIGGATVTLSNGGFAYSAEATTDQYGFAYFPLESGELAAGTYDLDVSATGYDSDTGTVVINGDLVTETVNLTVE